MKCLRCRKIIKDQSFYGLHIGCYLEWFKLSDLLEFSSLDPKKQDSNLNYPYIKKIKNSFYHGRYHKYSARLDNITYILKVQEVKFPDLPAIEYVCNNIASLLNLNVPEYYLIRYEGKNNLEVFLNKTPIRKRGNQNKGSRQKSNKELNQPRMTFVTRNFMQDYKGGTLHHIYKFLPKGEKNYSCKNIINVFSQYTKPIDVRQFIEMTLFDSLIGNNDRHGRNLGIIESSKRKRLAPMYDNPSYFGVESIDLMDFDFNISGCIRTSSSKKPKLLDYIQEFQSLGFEKACLKFIKKAVTQSQKIVETVECSEISKKRKEAFVKFLNKQLKIMEDFKNV